MFLEVYGRAGSETPGWLEATTRRCPSQNLRFRCKAPASILTPRQVSTCRSSIVIRPLSLLAETPAKSIATTLAGAAVLCQTLNFLFVVQAYYAKVFVPILCRFGYAIFSIPYDLSTTKSCRS
jgi:hypothetical protein